MSRLAGALVLTVLLAACSDGRATSTTEASDGDAISASSEGLMVIATTSILGDLTARVVGDAGRVQTLLPIGADPHGFAPSAAQATSLRDADLVVANGLDLEEGLTSALESAEDDGVTVFHATDHVDLIEFEDDDHAEEGDEHADEEGDEHADEEGDEHADEDEGDEHGDEDPHVWFDPARMAEVVEALGAELATIDPEAGFADRAAEVSADLTALDAEITGMAEALPTADRVLITNHEVLGYFADAYGFEVAATIIPGGTTLAEPSAAELEDVIDLVTDTGVRAIFAETTSGSRLAEVIADEVGGEVTVVELFTESLSDTDGPASTYIDMMRINAERIVEALAA